MHTLSLHDALPILLQNKEANDYVIATGKTHSVRNFVEKAFNVVDIQIEWTLDNKIETGRCKKTGKILVDINTDYNRPSETDHLLGDASKAKRDLNWKPKTNFEELVEMMVKKDLSRVENNSYSF